MKVAGHVCCLEDLHLATCSSMFCII